MSNRPFRGWIASLSTGETVFEQLTGKGELTAWQGLLQRCRNSNGNVRITQLRLQRGGITVTSIPKAAGYIQAYEAKISNLHRTQTHYQGIGSIHGDHVFITWVNDQGDVFQDVRPLKEVWMHTEHRQLVDIL